MFFYTCAANAFFSPSQESAQNDLNSLYQNYFYKLTARGKPIFRKEKDPEQIKSAFLELHKKASKIATTKGHWAYSVKKLPNICKEILETGQTLPNDFNKKIYPKNHIQFPKQTFYSLIDDCKDFLSDSPGILENYNKGVSQFLSGIDKASKQKEKALKKEKLAKEIEQKHPNYKTYTEWKERLNKVSKSKAFQFMCKKEHEYNPDLYGICLRSEHNSISTISASLSNLWKNSNGRNNMHEIIKLLESDIESSLKVIEGKTIPDMVLVKIKFKSNLKKYFKIKGFKVFDAIAVLN